MSDSRWVKVKLIAQKEGGLGLGEKGRQKGPIDEGEARKTNTM